MEFLYKFLSFSFFFHFLSISLLSRLTLDHMAARVERVAHGKKGKGLSAFGAVRLILAHFDAGIQELAACRDSILRQAAQTTADASETDELGTSLIPWTTVDRRHRTHEPVWWDYPSIGDIRTWSLRLQLSGWPGTRQISYFLRLEAKYGHDSNCRMLIDAGADPTDCDSRCLEEAAKMGHESTCRLLIDAGADPRAEDMCVGFAAAKGYDSICRLLIDAGADPKADDGWCLMYAAMKGHESTCRLLIDAGADPRESDSWCLQLAAMKGHESICRLLIDAGADVRADSRCITAASGEGRRSICRLLIAAGADPKVLMY